MTNAGYSQVTLQVLCMVVQLCSIGVTGPLFAKQSDKERILGPAAHVSGISSPLKKSPMDENRHSGEAWSRESGSRNPVVSVTSGTPGFAGVTEEPLFQRAVSGTPNFRSPDVRESEMIHRCRRWPQIPPPPAENLLVICVICG